MPRRQASRRATVLLPEAAGPSMAMRSGEAVVLTRKKSAGAAVLAGDFLEHFVEAGVGGVDAVGIGDDGVAFGEHAGDGEGHGDAVIAEALQACAVQRGAAEDGEA